MEEEEEEGERWVEGERRKYGRRERGRRRARVARFWRRGEMAKERWEDLRRVEWLGRVERWEVRVKVMMAGKGR